MAMVVHHINTLTTMCEAGSMARALRTSDYPDYGSAHQSQTSQSHTFALVTTHIEPLNQPSRTWSG